ncbi:hypothetical protein CcaverHIS002_0503240 [Cutaneotrichosporon cavernicola]|uniref:Zn(2)-C6 fungal-type domain-containing protein n=1 Tax=Cutaneotrichosporon cavernicola TaxID=279322 RepID=A0AA48L6B8_9TREE|nr:uncharacterized protein CcaverHIS019_0503810 [Cutaneotrichosporon cavernicola]BEI84923.1 hypothetical protein CcaverHIS002_0503240 [Cutaneotrichosporon cavernicola]BEI92753.1 hypothetical protein CcaverHIS019_0503810 [Cutaneotrichosporon cavernicola]BEJ00530.1 hypothetical protein CcaverHIS631_0503870 [Cutaneotrichosporon cavernicola]
MTGEPRIIRRRRGPFKRSRTGCGTCKRRGKKCDEIWNVDGFCQRCLAGPWECTGRSPGPTRSDAGAQVGYGLLAPMGLASVNGDAALQTGHATQAGVDCTNSLSSSPQPATNSNTIPDEGYLSLWGEMARAPRLPLNPFGSAVLTEGPPGSGSHAPHSHAPHNHAPHSHPPHSHPPQTTEQAFWDEIGANWSNVLDPASRVFNSDKPMRWGVSLAEIYARVVESWLVGLPGPTRDYARTRILALHDSNSRSAT